MRIQNNWGHHIVDDDKEEEDDYYGNICMAQSGNCYAEGIYKNFFFNFIYLFMRDTDRERGRDTGRGRSRLHAGSPMWDLIPGLQDHTLG